SSSPASRTARAASRRRWNTSPPRACKEKDVEPRRARRTRRFLSGASRRQSLLLLVLRGESPLEDPILAVDPITVSVVQHRLLAIVEEMGEAMLRTSYSQILNSSRDFSTGICDLDGRLIAQAEHVPIHVGALPWAARSVRDFFQGDIHPGDVFLLNDPYHGGNHLPDVTAFVPVFDGEKPVFWAINRAHQSDIGGATHGAYNAAATEIWQEGLRITPLRLYERGVLRRDVMELLAVNVRHPRDFRGDLAAMI